MEKVLELVNAYSHPDMIIRAMFGPGGVVITAYRNEDSRSYTISPDNIALLGKRELSEYIKDCIQTIVANLSIGLLQDTRSNRDDRQDD